MSFFEHFAKISPAVVAIPLLASCALFGDKDTDAFAYDEELAGSALVLPPDLAKTANDSLTFEQSDDAQDTDEALNSP